MAKTQTAEVLLKYSVDSASANRVRQSFAELEYGLSDLRSELTGMGSSAQAGIANLRTRFVQGEQSVVAMQDEVEELRRDLLALDDVTVTPTVAVQGAGGMSVKGNSALNTVDRFGRFGGQISGAFGASGSVGNVIGLVGDVADSFGTLGVVGGAAALAVGALSIAVNDLKESAENAAAAAQAQIEGSRAAAAQQADDLFTRLARFQAIPQEIGFEEQQIAAREAEIAANDAAFAMAKMSNALGLTTTNLVYLGNDLTAASDTARASIESSNTTITTLTAEWYGLREQIGPFLPLLTAIQAAAPGVTATFNTIVDGAQRAQEAVSGWSALVNGLTPVIDLVGKGLEDVRTRAAAAFDQLQSDKTDSYLNAITQTVTARENLAKAEAAYAEAVKASETRIAEINAKLQADLSEAEADRQRDLADAAREAGDERVKITEDAEKERARIQKRFEKSYANAVAERDALAAKRAEEQRKDELEQLDDRYTDQNKAVDDSLKKQQKVIEDRYKAQVATVNAAAQAAVRAEQAAAQARISALQQGVQAAQVALVNAQQAEFLTRANFYNQSLSQAQIWSNLMQLYTSYGFSIPTGAGRSGGGGIGGRTLPTPMATGGWMKPGRSYWVGEEGPELVTPTQPGYVNPTGTGFSVNINVTGAQSDTIRAVSRQQALNAFDGILRQMGVA